MKNKLKTLSILILSIFIGYMVGSCAHKIKKQMVYDSNYSYCISISEDIEKCHEIFDESKQKIKKDFNNCLKDNNTNPKTCRHILER